MIRSRPIVPWRLSNEPRPTKTRQFLKPHSRHLIDPYRLPDMEKGVERLVQAVINREKIGVHGDYDVDGTCGAALLAWALRGWGLEVDAFVPERDKDHYGIAERALRYFRLKDIRLAISTDTGTCAVNPIASAKDKNIDFIVCDHHEPDAVLPQALAIINPHLSQKKLPDLSGAGVAFYLLRALSDRLKEEHFFSRRGFQPLKIDDCLDLVAIAAIADVIPLRDDTRTLVALGLPRLQTSERPAMVALRRRLGFDERPIAVRDLSMRVIPTLNAAGRLFRANHTLDFLLCKDLPRAMRYARELLNINEKRKRIQRNNFAEAALQVKQNGLDQLPVMVVASDQWHIGVGGAVAGRLLSEFRRPVVILPVSNGVGVGSLRSDGTINCKDLVEAMRDEFLDSGGGHARAAGLRIAAEKIPAFAEAAVAFVKKTSGENPLPRPLFYDDEILLSAVDESLLAELEKEGPFGEGNPEYTFRIRDVEVINAALSGNFLRLKLRQGNEKRTAIMPFFEGHPPKRHSRIEALATLTRRFYKGESEVQLVVKDFR